MKTPFDTALRVAERKVDKVRIAIGRAVQELQRIEAQHVAAEKALERESLLASGDPQLTAQHFFVRARDRRMRLGMQRVETHARLEDLRRKAVECYGSLNAMEGAVDRFRENADREATAVEQAAIDDMTSAAHIRRMSNRRRVTAIG